VNKRFRVCSYDQPFLLPPSLQDWLPENHLARFIAEVMNELDLSSIYANQPAGGGDNGPWWSGRRHEPHAAEDQVQCALTSKMIPRVLRFPGRLWPSVW
jgi:hypothetical protein